MRSARKLNLADDDYFIHKKKLQQIKSKSSDVAQSISSIDILQQKMKQKHDLVKKFKQEHKEKVEGEYSTHQKHLELIYTKTSDVNQSILYMSKLVDNMHQKQKISQNFNQDERELEESKADRSMFKKFIEIDEGKFSFLKDLHLSHQEITVLSKQQPLLTPFQQIHNRVMTYQSNEKKRDHNQLMKKNHAQSERINKLLPSINFQKKEEEYQKIMEISLRIQKLPKLSRVSSNNSTLQNCSSELNSDYYAQTDFDSAINEKLEDQDFDEKFQDSIILFQIGLQVVFMDAEIIPEVNQEQIFLQILAPKKSVYSSIPNTIEKINELNIKQAIQYQDLSQSRFLKIRVYQNSDMNEILIGSMRIDLVPFFHNEINEKSGYFKLIQFNLVRENILSPIDVQNSMKFQIQVFKFARNDQIVAEKNEQSRSQKSSI